MILKIKLIYSLVFTLIFFSSASFAEDIPYNSAGIIDSIRYEDNTIIISDIAYPISSAVIVHAKGVDIIGPQHLVQNQTVGYNKERNTVTEVWIIDKIPDNFISLW